MILKNRQLIVEVLSKEKGENEASIIKGLNENPDIELALTKLMDRAVEDFINTNNIKSVNQKSQ